MESTRTLPFDGSFLRKIEDGETWAERVWKRVPVLGWIVASHLWAKRAGPIRRRLFQQLLTRPRTPISVWGGAGKIAQIVCEVAQTEMGWPSASFIPEDPFAVVFWSYDDGLDAVSAVLELEERFNCSLPDEVIASFVERTLGEFVEYLASHCDALTNS